MPRSTSLPAGRDRAGRAAGHTGLPKLTNTPPTSPACSTAQAAAVWGGVQCAALAAAAGGVRLWAHHPDPPASIALAEVTAAQLVAAALLFPAIFPRRSAVAVAIALIVAFDTSAGVLSATPAGDLLRTAGFTTIWVVGLAMWAKVGGSVAPRLGVVAAFGATVGGALLLYARAESAAAAGMPLPDAARFGPLTAGICMAAGRPVVLSAWAVAAGPLIVAGVAGVILHRRRSFPASAVA